MNFLATNVYFLSKNSFFESRMSLFAPWIAYICPQVFSIVFLELLVMKNNAVALHFLHQINSTSRRGITAKMSYQNYMKLKKFDEDGELCYHFGAVEKCRSDFPKDDKTS